jgi:hypothetical protein
MNTRLLTWTGVAAAFLVVAAAVVITIFGWWPVVVDIVLVITALVSGVMLMALTLAVISFASTVREMREEIIPVMESLKATSNAVRETARTATSIGVAPAVRTASFVVGASEIASVVLGRGRARKRAQERQKRRHEIEREMAARGEFNGR